MAIVQTEELSKGEQRVLDALCGGLTNREIAGHLGIALETVKTYLHNIYRKLGISSRTQAVRYWWPYYVSPAERGIDNG